MAIISVSDLASLRQRCAADATGGVTWTKAQVNAAVQALEDWFDTTGRAGAAAAIESAAPGVFTNTQKKLIGKYWLAQKSGRE
jgi:hypothetical protein